MTNENKLPGAEAAEEVVSLNQDTTTTIKSDESKSERKAAPVKSSLSRKLASGAKQKAAKAGKGASKVKKIQVAGKAPVKAKKVAAKAGAKASAKAGAKAAPKAAAKRAVAKKPRISGMKAQTQVAKDVMAMIKHEAKGLKVRPADVVRSIIYKHFKFTAAADAR